MATPVRERRGSRRDEESSSRELFVPSNNLVRDKTDSARADAATDKNGGALQLEKITSSLESKFPELSFTLGRALDNDKQVLVVSQRVLAFMPPFGYTSRIRVTIQENCRYRVHVLLRTLEDGTVSDEAEVYALLKKLISILMLGRAPQSRLTFEAINVSSQKPCTLRGHFTQAYWRLDTLSLFYY